MKKVKIINGPNLNLLGKRETDIYGFMSFDDYLIELKSKYKKINIDYFQSNIEGEIINEIQKCGFNDYNAIILNAGGYTHTSVSIADAISSIETDVIEVHISNIFSREEYRKKSLLSSNCKGIISGFGLKVYELAIRSIN